MSAVTVVSAGAPDRRPVHPDRGLARTVIRPHQSALWFWGLLVALIGGGLLWAAGPGLDAAWTGYLKSGCAETDYCEPGPAYHRYDLLVTLGPAALTVVPALIGAWAGGSLIGRELESGTARLAWTQSVAPAHWLAAKLAVPAALIVSGTVLLTLLNRLVWWREEALRHAVGTRDWFDHTTFTGSGTLATAYALLALAVGVVAGLLLRRSLPALAAGSAGTLALMIALQGYRERLWPVVEAHSATPEPRWTGALIDQGVVTASGDRLSNMLCEQDDCGRGDVVGYWTEYHPSSHFWPLQLVETGIVLAVTGLLVLASFHLLRRRTGGMS
ncbi:ABC transporter permease [Streptomyces heilongjiangensis]|uniref:ABC transporter permease n=1 Tax=Streptomyces heilongjiangensis TaxID=945052 RepID=A0ABW1BHX3_9ACTN|nr:ABC transporter permease [Streptomyces heilongjiangensis]MDC2951344.1 ABC transporter permease [Streptomyces heilongjiangensis]